MNNKSNFDYVSKLGKYFKLSGKPPLFTYGQDEFLFTAKKKKFSYAGFEPAILCSVGKCLIHWASRKLYLFSIFIEALAELPGCQYLLLIIF